MARKKIINIYSEIESGKTVSEILSGYSMENGEVAVLKTDNDATIAAKISGEEDSCVEFASKKYVDLAKKELSHSKPVKFADFLYGINYSHIDYEYGLKCFEKDINTSHANCSALRVGDFAGRNFDWKYGWMATFVVSTPAEYGRKAVIGVSGNLSKLTVDAVDSEKEFEEYSFLPFRLLDGINEDGLFCEINVTHKSNIDRVQPTGEKTATICSEMLPRYILDHYSTVDEAISGLQEHVEIYTPKSLLDMNYEIHCLVADKDKTVVLEFDDVSGRLVYTDAHIITNFKLFGVEFNEDGSVYTNVDAKDGKYPTVENNLEPYADGLERWNILNTYSASVVDNKTMRDLMASINYSKAYTNDLDETFWYSEFVGEGPDADITVDTPYDDETFQKRCNFYKEGYSARTRDVDGYWITCHQCVYDIDKKEFTVCVQENAENEYKFSFENVNFDEIIEMIKVDEEVVSTALNDLNDRIIAVDGKFVNYYTKSEAYSKNEADSKIAEEISKEAEITEATYAKKSEIPSLNGYATESWVEGKGYLTEHQSLDDYAKKTDIPTKTSDLTNDSGFLTNSSLDDYYTKDELTGENGIITENELVTASALVELDERVKFGTSIEIEATGAVVTRKNIKDGDEVVGQKFEISVEGGSNYEAGDGISIDDNMISIETSKLSAINKITGDTVSISGTQINVGSEIVFSAGNDEEEGKFEPSSSVTKALNWLKENKVSKSYFDGTLANYATKSNLDNAIKTETARTESTYLKEHQSLEGYATEEWVENKGYLTEHQSLGNYYTKSETDSAIENSVSGKQQTLVSGENIKTINGESILGSGNIVIQGGGTDVTYSISENKTDTGKTVYRLTANDSPTGAEIVSYTSAKTSEMISAAMNSETARTETAYAKKTALEGKQDKITNLPEIIDNAASGKTAYDKLGGHTVEKDVPADAKFTDTIYDDTSLTNRISAIEGKEAEWDAKLQSSDIIDNTVSTATTKALSANQGKVLNDTISENTQQLRLSINGEKVAREAADIALENSISQKQNTISDLQTIRDNAASGKNVYDFVERIQSDVLMGVIVNGVTASTKSNKASVEISGTNITVGENISGYTSSESSLTESLRAAFEIIDRLDSYPSLPKLPELEKTMTGNIPPENAWVGETVEIPSVDWYLKSGEFIANYSNEFENWPIPSYASETSTSEPRTGFTYIDDTHATVCEGDNVIKYKAYADYSAPTNKPLRKSGIQTDKTGRTDTNTSAIWPASGLDDEYKIMTTGEWAIISNALECTLQKPENLWYTGATAATEITTVEPVIKSGETYVTYLGMQDIDMNSAWKVFIKTEDTTAHQIYITTGGTDYQETLGSHQIDGWPITGNTSGYTSYTFPGEDKAITKKGQYLKITFKNKQQ